ncbi:DUF4139 domain-containing protein [Budviciaceae bacterium CWB-B4]|uniref:DUF4139 domain-containing protein n=1 Tax=Limnobaculum xujianqingii TaxID=2738837 RepID=A0A9D7AHC7_9GAMM|nr:DUF4139 domain-containing protein [Limnobaculum xujianqingii]MBK5072723.1 DUF4139 domain-containing protein [Limnobaculum xujianqingii]MBK5176032.1 DUF4139 domain-containing protein [Limnobaculum xujianqingii]
MRLSSLSLSFLVLFSSPVFLSSASADTSPPLKRVMLSSAGVGYFEYETDVEGPTTLTLSIPRDQIDDVLKSMTIDGANGGAVSVRMPDNEPLEKGFRDFLFTPASLESPARLLSELRGAEVSIEGPRSIKGKLMSVEAETVALDDKGGTQNRYRVSLITDEGLKQAILQDVQSLRFEDEKLRNQINQALTLTAAAQESGPRQLDIVLSGKGKRQVKIGYVASTPIWKVAYRAQLGKDDRAHLQGWAILENTSGRDWKDVELTLLSGNPIAFRQPLYQSYYVNRPVVPVETLNQQLPVIDSGELDGRMGQGRYNRLVRTEEKQLQLNSGQFMAAPAALAARDEAAEEREIKETWTSQAAPQAEAIENQSQIVLKLPELQTIASGQSMMTPIIDRDIPAVRHTLLNNNKPIVAVEIANQSTTGLPPGAITFYDGVGDTTYLGDGQIGALPVGEKRLVGFASDLNVRIIRDAPTTKDLYSASVKNGVVQIKNSVRQTTTYRMKSSAKEKRIVVLDIPRRANETLVEPNADASGISLIQNGYRIRHPLDAGKEETLNIVTESVKLESLSFEQMQSIDRNSLDFYMKTIIHNGSMDDGTKKIFSQIANMRQPSIDADEAIASLQDSREVIISEQQRLRENLAQVPNGSDLQKRYLKQMEQQEDKMSSLLSQIEAEKDKKAKADVALKVWLNSN